MQYQTVKDLIENDLSNLVRLKAYGEWPVSEYDCDELGNGKIYYIDPHLCCGDLVGTEKDRLNVQTFKSRFQNVEGWRLRTHSHATEFICIDITCSDKGIIRFLSELREKHRIADAI